MRQLSMVLSETMIGLPGLVQGPPQVMDGL